MTSKQEGTPDSSAYTRSRTEVQDMRGVSLMTDSRFCGFIARFIRPKVAALDRSEQSYEFGRIDNLMYRLWRKSPH